MTLETWRLVIREIVGQRRTKGDNVKEPNDAVDLLLENFVVMWLANGRVAFKRNDAHDEQVHVEAGSLEILGNLEEYEMKIDEIPDSNDDRVGNEDDRDDEIDDGERNDGVVIGAVLELDETYSGLAIVVSCRVLDHVQPVTPLVQMHANEAKVGNGTDETEEGENDCG